MNLPLLRLGSNLVLLVTLLYQPDSHAEIREDQIYTFAECAPYSPNFDASKEPDERRRAALIFARQEFEKLPPDWEKTLEVGLSRPQNFPSWGADLLPVLRAVENQNRKLETESCRADRPAPALIHPMMRSLATVGQRLITEIDTTVASQQEDADRALDCLNRVSEADPDVLTIHKGENPTVNFQARQFSAPKGENLNSEMCAVLTNYLVQNLTGRHTRMRYYMAMIDGPPAAGKPLQHDEPFSRFLLGDSLSSQSESRAEVAPITAEEMPKLIAFRKNMKTDRRPIDLYDQILSTTPVLLKMNGGVSAQSLKLALSEMKKDRSEEFGENRRELPQETFLKTVLVARAIGTLPLEERPLACKSVSQLYRNLIQKYQKNPRLLSALEAATIVAAVIPNPGTFAAWPAVAKFFLESRTKRAVGVTSISAAQKIAVQLERYNRGVQFCSQIFREKFEAPEVDGLCAIRADNEILQKAEVQATSNALMGTTAVVMRKPVKAALEKLKGPTRALYERIKRSRQSSDRPPDRPPERPLD